MKATLLAAALALAALAYVCGGPGSAQGKPAQRMFAKFDGVCTVKQPEGGAFTGCDDYIVNVIFEDGYLSYQFHSKQKTPGGQFEWVVDFVGPEMSKADKNNAKLYVMSAETMHFLYGNNANHPIDKKFAHMGCLMTLKDPKNISPAALDSVYCLFGEDKAHMTTFELDNMKIRK
ncbi:MAG: hypothetical protein ACLPN5_03880 [Roseiarcus sp.]